jgi:alkylation response protein AidB-like acyl-CoA dehydrogenase
MELNLVPCDDPRRAAVRQWLAEHPHPSGHELAHAGLVAPHWPAPYGLDADPTHQLMIDAELAAAGVARPSNPIGIGWAGPTILQAGTPEQHERYLFPLLSGEEIWCQLFSEPEAGSDLAGLVTRAERDGNEFVVDGQKIWTSGAQNARFGILLARTDPAAPKHRGLSYFICPMDAPGIEIRPIREMTGGYTFNEVFLTRVRLPESSLVGAEGDGWRLAKATLGNERVSLSTGGVLWGSGPTAVDLLAAARTHDVSHDPVMRDRLSRVHVEHTLLELIRRRTVSARLRGEAPGPEASVRKVLADEHGQQVMGVARDLLGARAQATSGVAPDSEPIRSTPWSASLESDAWAGGFLFSPALTIGGGTGEVQRNIIGERVLGLPGEPDPSR